MHYLQRSNQEECLQLIENAATATIDDCYFHRRVHTLIRSDLFKTLDNHDRDYDHGHDHSSPPSSSPVNLCSCCCCLCSVGQTSGLLLDLSLPSWTFKSNTKHIQTHTHRHVCMHVYSALPQSRTNLLIMIYYKLVTHPESLLRFSRRMQTPRATKALPEAEDTSDLFLKRNERNIEKPN